MKSWAGIERMKASWQLCDGVGGVVGRWCLMDNSAPQHKLKLKFIQTHKAGSDCGVRSDRILPACSDCSGVRYLPANI